MGLSPTEHASLCWTHFATAIVWRYNFTSMGEESETIRTVRFGTFELDLAAGELRKNGRKPLRHGAVGKSPGNASTASFANTPA